MRISRIIAASVIITLVAASCASADVAGTVQSKRIALTFDDAPRGDGPMFSGDERAARLIAALQKADVAVAGFFFDLYRSPSSVLSLRSK